MKKRDITTNNNVRELFEEVESELKSEGFILQEDTVKRDAYLEALFDISNEFGFDSYLDRIDSESRFLDDIFSSREEWIDV
jgi:hypothetical protein